MVTTFSFVKIQKIIIEKMKNLLITGVSALALLSLTAKPAQAALLSLEVQNGAFTDNATFTGSFDYDTDTQTYSNWNLIAPAGSTVTRSFTYTVLNSASPALYPTGDLLPNSPNYFSLGAKSGPSNGAPNNRNYNTIALGFNKALNTLVSVGQTTSIDLDYSFEGTRRGSNTQSRSLTGGTVVVTSIAGVPEPLTVLGALTAVGFGVAFKLRKKN